MLLLSQCLLKQVRCFLQTEGPPIHLLRDMCELLELMMGCFIMIKSQALKDKVGKHLLAVEYAKTGMSSDQQKISFQGTKEFYVATTNYVIGHLYVTVNINCPRVRRLSVY